MGESDRKTRERAYLLAKPQAAQEEAHAQNEQQIGEDGSK